MKKLVTKFLFWLHPEMALTLKTAKQLERDAERIVWDKNVERNKRHRNNGVNYKYFKVCGAGDIQINDDHLVRSSMDENVGPDLEFNVEWGIYGFVGGSIRLDEAKRLSDYILERIKRYEESK